MPAMSSANYEPPANQGEFVENQFSEHPMERWRSDAMTVGVTSAMEAYMRDTIGKFNRFRADTTSFVDSLIATKQALTAREDAVAQRERVVADLMRKAAQLLDRINKRLGDAEKFSEEPATPPGADDILPPETLPLEEEPELEDPEEQDDPELSDSTNGITGDDELPPELAKLEPKETPRSHGSVFSQRVAISLNEE
jgi:hypothetical protein